MNELVDPMHPAVPAFGKATPQSLAVFPGADQQQPKITVRSVAA